MVLAGGLEGVRWQDDDQLHLTLRYIGEVSRHQAEDIAQTVQGVQMETFTLGLAGVGSFDSRGKVNALWAGVAPRDAATRLHLKLDQALIRLGLPAEGRAYVPHITLGRTNRTPPGLTSWLADNAMLASHPFPVEEFILYESFLSAARAEYAAIARYPLISTNSKPASMEGDAMQGRSR
jgi:2'-5' RNA ligase